MTKYIDINSDSIIENKKNIIINQYVNNNQSNNGHGKTLEIFTTFVCKCFFNNIKRAKMYTGRRET